MFESLHETVLVSVGTELWVGCRHGVELVHVDKAVVGQHRLHPDATDVVAA